MPRVADMYGEIGGVRTSRFREEGKPYRIPTGIRVGVFRVGSEIGGIREVGTPKFQLMTGALGPEYSNWAGKPVALLEGKPGLQVGGVDRKNDKAVEAAAIELIVGFEIKGVITGQVSTTTGEFVCPPERRRLWGNHWKLS